MKPQKPSSRGSDGREKLLLKLTLLTLIKESYLFIANIYGLLFHPYLTVKKVTKDHSQLVIFFFLWLVSWVFLFSLLVFLVFTGGMFPWKLTKAGFLFVALSAIFLLSISSYCLFWWFKDFKLEKTAKNLYHKHSLKT